MSSDAGAASVDSFDFELYRYTPSLPAAIVSVAIFAVLTAVHVWRMLRARAFYFTPFVIGGILQVIGYCGRIWGHFDKLSIPGFILGEKIIIAGLFAQIVVFGFFVVTSVLFHRRMNAQPPNGAWAAKVPWRRYLWVLYATSAVILVRSVFRVVEYLQGNGGYLISREIFLYVFDALLMALCMLIFAVWYVGHLEKKQKRKGRRCHGQDGVEMEMGRR
ncbi:hypothetical protein VdG1_06901 [Verticillium dahliae VDG1]|nr:hypothetical protein VdG1_06901 [Verticillium dahliae VDG1]